ncbi:hypothetical protein LguiA_035473 [Lonicera macranthoides]
MNHLNSPNQKHFSSKNNKKRLNQDQVKHLELSFDSNKRLEPELKLRLSRELGIPPRQIAIWYQNKRARWKNQSLELDYSTLQIRLENTLAEKKQLEREVERLQVELRKVQQDQAQQPPTVSSISSTCCDEGGSSSLQDDVNNCWVNDHDLYAYYFMGANGSNCA